MKSDELQVPSFFLHGLHTYIYSLGIKAVIRTLSDITTSGIKPRKKTHEKFEFDENEAQIFRLKLTHNHHQSRLYFDQFNGAFNFTIVACSLLLIHNFLPVSKGSFGVLPNGTLIPILLGFIGVVRVLFIIFKVSFERYASKRSEKQLSVLIGCLGTIIGFLIVLEVIPNWVFDFGSKFESLDRYAKFCTAMFMGFLAGLLYLPAVKFARAYWLRTDQIRCNLSMFYEGRR
ncbi:putative transmembrane protein 161A/B [Helianthus annuus]|nr:putative transmembrane protein 161A/B [Helianthus annuus]